MAVHRTTPLEGLKPALCFSFDFPKVEAFFFGLGACFVLVFGGDVSDGLPLLPTPPSKK